MMKLRLLFNFSLISATVLILLIPVSVYAQKSVKHDQKEELYRKALDLFEKEKYGSAQRTFEQVRAEQTDSSQSSEK